MNLITQPLFFDFAPTPILKEIAEYCDTPAIRNLRVTCKKFCLIIADAKFQELFLNKLVDELKTTDGRWSVVLEKMSYELIGRISSNDRVLKLFHAFNLDSTDTRIQLLMEKLYGHKWENPGEDYLMDRHKSAKEVLRINYESSKELDIEQCERDYPILQEKYPGWASKPLLKAVIAFYIGDEELREQDSMEKFLKAFPSPDQPF